MSLFSKNKAKFLTAKQTKELGLMAPETIPSERGKAYSYDWEIQLAGNRKKYVLVMIHELSNGQVEFIRVLNKKIADEKPMASFNSPPVESIPAILSEIKAKLTEHFQASPELLQESAAS